MDIKCWVAMNGAEFSREALPPNPAWMSCRFAPGGAGLSNLPPFLPTGAMVLLDDSTPPAGHDPLTVAAQLNSLVRAFGLAGIILDFQRPGSSQTYAMASYLVKALPCPVCVAYPYSQGLSGPVLLPPPPPHQLPKDYFAPWEGRELWLEAVPDAEEITLTREGAAVRSIPIPQQAMDFTEDVLFCKYKLQILPDRAVFTLVRDRQMLNALLHDGVQYGVTRAVGISPLSE